MSNAKAHTAMQTRRRKEETERRERARVVHDERVARRDAYRERGYHDEPGEAMEQAAPDTGSDDSDTSLLDAVADMDEEE